MSLSNNETQIELIAQLSDLNRELSNFIKGDANVTISTNSGLVKSISGIARDLEQFRYIQKVIDHRLLIDALTDDIEIGMLVRIWGDTDETNGLYKLLDSGYIKISYDDIYDLRDKLPNPWNYIQIKKNKTEFVNDLTLFTYTLPTSSIQINDDYFEGTLKVTVDEPTKKGSYLVKFIVHMAVGDISTAMKFISLDYISELDILNFNTVTLPQITVDVLSDVLKHTFFFKVSSPLDGVAYLPATMELNLAHIDAKKYKST